MKRYTLASLNRGFANITAADVAGIFHDDYNVFCFVVAEEAHRATPN